MSENEYSTTIHLSHLLASQIGVTGDQSLVVDAIYNSKDEITEEKLHDIIEDQFHVDINVERIKNAVKNLLSTNKLYINGNNILHISLDTMEVISGVIAENEKCETEALLEWLDNFQRANNIIFSDEDSTLAKSCILSFIKTFFLTHGADCYKLISGEKQSEYYDLDTLAEKSANAFVGKHHDIFVRFLRGLFTNDISSKQKNFLLTQLKKAINYLSTVINKDAQAALIRNIDGLTMYLDTTVLYRLLNLQGEMRYATITKLIEFCKSSNVKLKVFQTTVNEMRRRIAYDAKVITNHPTPVSFASIGYESRTSENYISTFWNEQRQTGISVTDFNFKYSNIKLLLDNLKIDIDENDYIANESIAEEKANLLSIVPQYVTRINDNDNSYQKSDNAIEHDAECIAIIQHLQLKNVQTAIESRTLFLTTDWSIIRLQRNNYHYRDKVDFAVLPSQMMQIFCMTTPTNTYLETFMGLFSSSHSYFGSSALSNEQIQEIMGRVASYKGATPSFAEKVLTNQLVQNAFTEKETEEEKNNLVDDAILEEVESMETALEKTSGELTKKSAEVERIKNDNEDKKAKIEDLGRRIEALEERQLKSTETVSVYEEHFKKTSSNIAKIKSIACIILGILLIVIGAVCFLVSLSAMIPPLSIFVEPIIQWILTAKTFEGETGIPIQLLAIIIPLAIAIVGAGIKLFGGGYGSLFEKYYNKELNKITK